MAVTLPISWNWHTSLGVDEAVAAADRSAFLGESDGSLVVTVDHLNATSTCDYGLRAGLACESVRTLMFARAKITPEQRLAP